MTSSPDAIRSAPGGVDPIKHVVLLMLENHSFDQMMGALQSVYPGLDGVDPEMQNPASAMEPRFNLSLAGKRINQTITDELQVERDPIHETENVLIQIADGNAGFVKDYEQNVAGVTADDMLNLMGYYALGRLPALHQLGSNFTVCDRWFSSLPGPTWPNRFFALTGTSSGRVLMPSSAHPRLDEFTAQDQVTIFDRLNDRGRTWKVYFYDFPVSLLLKHQREAHNLAHYHLIQDFFERDVHGESGFPDFVLIEPKYMGVDQNDDHPPHNVYKAEKLIADVYNAIRSSPGLWASTLLVISYDEHGGFYDHVVPPAAVPPDDHREEWTFDRLGVRVPALLISPWVTAGVEKTEFDHTSLLRYLIDKWGLGPLGRRTAAANSIGVAIQTTMRSDTIPFIRVPYTDLVPPDAELEAGDVSRHHEAIHSFASWLAKLEGLGIGAVINDLARASSLWVRIKAWFGAVFRRIAEALLGESGMQRTKQIDAIGQVARDVVRKANKELGSGRGPLG